MPKYTVIDAKNRLVKGKKVRALRREGQIPAVVYGKRDPLAVQLPFQSTMLLLRDAGDNDILDLNVDGQSYKVLVRDVQRHVLRGDIMHVDFLEVNMDEAIRAEVVINMVGDSPLTGGSVSVLLHAIEIEATPDKLISEVNLDASLIDREDKVLHVSDLVVPEGVTIITDLEIGVAKYDIDRELPEEELEDEGLEVEGVDVTSILESAEE